MEGSRCLAPCVGGCVGGAGQAECLPLLRSSSRGADLPLRERTAPGLSELYQAERWSAIRNTTGGALRLAQRRPTRAARSQYSGPCRRPCGPVAVDPVIADEHDRPADGPVCKDLGRRALSTQW